MKLVSKKEGSVTSIISTKLSEYDALRQQKSFIESRMTTLAKEIKDFCTKNCPKNDKGSYYGSDDNFIFGSQAKKSVSLDSEKAIEYLRSHGFDDAIEYVPKVKEDVLEKLVSDESIPQEDFESLTKIKTSYSIDIKRKEEVPAVEEGKTVLAASKKPVKKGGKK